MFYAFSMSEVPETTEPPETNSAEAADRASQQILETSSSKLEKVLESAKATAALLGASGGIFLVKVGTDTVAKFLPTFGQIEPSTSILVSAGLGTVGIGAVLTFAGGSHLVKRAYKWFRGKQEALQKT